MSLNSSTAFVSVLATGSAFFGFGVGASTSSATSAAPVVGVSKLVANPSAWELNPPSTASNADDATDKEKQSGIEVEFLRRFNERGIDNVSSRDYGTAYRSTRSSVTIDDWDIFLKHVKKNEAWELLEHRANKKSAQEYAEVHGEIVPGTKYSETQVVNFRRK